ncbi:hypothetical protein COCON_G00194770 [Conger conger]|uniref:Uncharacterized protein n=1 Tax=Conger conger TaxID=82655 RepID=A0A9Q1D1R3_CONCO|nr:hypothetical protein COCON_G00194770 [Conger conger]
MNDATPEHDGPADGDWAHATDWSLQFIDHMVISLLTAPPKETWVCPRTSGKLSMQSSLRENEVHSDSLKGGF